MFWEPYVPLIQALIELFHPLMEVAIHDLEEGKIVAMFHPISKRKVGDPSPLNELEIDPKNFPDYFSPYYKKNWDGNSLKCTSITIRNPKGEAIGLICFNIDVSLFEMSKGWIENFLSIEKRAKNPIELFGGDCEEQCTHLIEEYLREHKCSLQHITRIQKKDLVQYLYKKGLFNFKNAVPLVAKKLRTSRATIYNYFNDL